MVGIAIELDRDGFLGNAGKGVERRLHAELGEYFEVAREMNRVATELRIPRWNRDERTVCAMGLFRKLHHDAQGVFLLAGHGLVEEAMTLGRVAFEALVMLALVHEDPVFWKEYEDAQQPFRAKAMIARKMGWAGVEPTEEVVEEASAHLSAIGKETKATGAKPLPKLDELIERLDSRMAERLGVEPDSQPSGLAPVYHTLYQLGNLPTHSSIKVAERLLDALQAGEDHIVDPSMLKLVVLNVAGVLASATQIAFETFDEVEAPPSLSAVFERFQTVKAAFEQE